MKIPLLRTLCSDYIASNMESLLEQEVAPPDISEEPQGPDDVSTVLFRKYITTRDAQSFQIIFEQNKQYVLWLANKYIQHSQNAEDIAQEVWIKAMHTHYLKESVSIKQWLAFMVRRLCYDQKRYKDRKIHAGHSECPLSFDIQDSHETTQDQMIEADTLAEKVENIRSIYRRLPEHYQQVLYLRYVDCMPLREIGNIFGKSEATMRLHCERACSDFSERYQRIILKRPHTVSHHN